MPGEIIYKMASKVTNKDNLCVNIGGNEVKLQRKAPASNDYG